jgi:hypothetical protein
VAKGQKSTRQQLHSRGDSSNRVSTAAAAPATIDEQGAAVLQHTAQQVILGLCLCYLQLGIGGPGYSPMLQPRAYTQIA